jgi:ribose transport system substrate-binding protein
MTLCGIPAFASGNTDKPAGDRIGVTLIAKNETDGEWRQVKAGAAAKAAELKNVDLAFRAPAENADASAQNKLLEDAITAKTNVILITPIAADAIAAGIEKAKSAGIKVVMIGSGSASDKYDASVTANFSRMAQVAADTLAELVEEKGTIAIINGKGDDESMKILENDFERQIRTKHPDITILAVQYSNGDAEKAKTQTLDIIEAEPDISGFYGCDESSTVGIARAIVKSGSKGKTRIVGVGLTDTTKSLLREKSVQAIMAQDPYRTGYEALDAGVRVFKGEELTEKKIAIPVKVATEENPDATK